MAATKTAPARTRARRSQPQHHHTAQPVAAHAEFVSRLQAAQLCSVNVQTVDAAIARGVLPAYRFGRRVLIKRTELLGVVVSGQV